MRFREIREELTPADVSTAELFANRALSQYNIEVYFTGHFRKQINLPRNRPKIKLAEIVRLFRQVARQQGKRLENLEPYTKLLLRDNKTKINIIVNIKQGSSEDKLLFSCTTVIRADNFGKDAKETIFVEAVGRITKQNQTSDVGPQEIKTQAAKFGNTVDKDGRPPTLSKKTKGSKTNVLFNLGLTESQNKKLYQEATGEIANSTEIFVDMDGVLADFFGSWADLMGVEDWREINKKHDIDDALERIRQSDDFWINLPLTANAFSLLNLIKQVKGKYKILSSPLPGDKNSEPHKRLWVKEHLDFFPPEDVIITHDKAKYATQPDGTPNILIDDYGVNISKWEAAGGIGFKHKDHKFERTAKNIKQHIEQPVEEKWTKKYKSSIDCNNPKGFSQKAHCAGKKKNEDREIGIHRSSEDFAVIDLSKSADGTFWLNGVDNTDWDNTVTTGKGIDMAFEISPQAKLASYDDIDKYSTGELENMGYDGVRMIDGDNIAYQIWNTDILKRTKLGENFADGKKKGKSRPGRVKRAGASCNGSVTSLRKKAKNASGEKAKMYHWCANMKSGRKKS